MKPVSEERLKEAAQLYKSGLSFVEIQKALHIGQHPLQRALNKYGVKSRPPVMRPLSEEEEEMRRQALAAYYLEGHSLSQCLSKFHIGSSLAAQYLKDCNIVQRYHWCEENIQALVDMYQDGMSLADCATTMSVSKGICRKRLRQAGVPLRLGEGGTGKREENPNWKGGPTRKPGKYVYVMAPPGHPRKLHAGYILEHHLVMEKHIGRYLLPGEVVHHKNKKKDDNRIKNLQLFSSNAEHLAAELAGQCPKWSEDGKRRINEARQLRCAKAHKKSRSKTGVRQ